MKNLLGTESQSKIREWIDEVQNAPSYEIAKQIAIEKTRNLHIFETSKKKMLFNLQYKVSDHASLLKYLYNSILIFEGMGTK